VAYQSEIELRVKVLDKELDELERRLKNIQNPFDVSGKRKRTPAQAAAVRSQIAEADLIRRSIEDLDRLREAKAEKRLRTNIRRVRYLRSQRIAAVRQVERAEDQLAKNVETQWVAALSVVRSHFCSVKAQALQWAAAWVVRLAV